MSEALTIKKSFEEGTVVVYLGGRLDTTTSPALQAAVMKLFDEPGQTADIILDLEKLIYVSSAGLRVLLMSEKKCRAEKRKQFIRGASNTIREIFDVTGFTGMLNII
jgi:anti-anti-sigma factor